MSSVREQESQSVTEQAKERVQDVTAQAKSQTREQLRSQISERSTQVGDQAVTAAKAVRRASEQLRTEGNGRAADAIDALADRGDRFGAYLRRADGDQILRDVEEFARTKPWLMVGGSAVAGFLASRFMKATSRDRFRQGARQNGYPSRPFAGTDRDRSVGATDPAVTLPTAEGNGSGVN
jgi:ElaB/YqjD/DUF883 family membrane-anchored ribosome-binding protein